MMSEHSPNATDWPVLLGQLIKAKQAIRDRDPEQLEPYTVPRVKATEEEVAALEHQIGERFDPHYRSFLLHGNGWPNVLYDLGLFGTPEFKGGGNWPIANDQLGFYDTEGVLASSGLEAGGVMPIAAGEGMIDLIVVIRPGWKDAGTVVWFDGGEFDRWPDFTQFIQSLIADKNAQAEALVADNNESSP